MDGKEFIRVVTKDDEECFLLTTLKARGKEGFELTVCQGADVWTGAVTENELDDLSGRLKMEFDRYVSQTVEALTSNSETKETFQYQLKRQKDSVVFVWKKYVPAEDITFQLGSAKLQLRPDAADFIANMFNHCIQSMDELRERIHSLETDNERLSKERINALKRLENCVVAKENLEIDLYSKFSLVLNSKKEKISQLKRQVEEGLQEGRTATTDESEASTSAELRQGMTRTPHETGGGDEEQSDSGKDTDEETPKRKKRRTAQPRSTQLKSADDSLVLGGDDDGQESAVVARPRRQRGPQKKQTPSKPVLPRVGSNETESGGERKTRLKKSSSSTSKSSSDNVDPDDLLSQL